MALTEITNHADLAVANLLEQFKAQSQLEGLIRAIMAPVQDLEPVLHDLDTELRLDNAVGQQLDELGVVVQLLRGGLADDDYRTRLRARIRSNRSEGTGDDIMEVLRLMLGATGNDFTLEEYYPAGIVLRIADALSEDPAVLASEAMRSRLAGVRQTLEYTTVDDDDTFQFASGDSPEADASAGFTGGYGWAAVGADYVTTSDNGSSWTERTQPSTETLAGIADNGSGTVIAVGEDDATDPYMIRSTDDGATWEELDPPDSAIDLNAICYSPDLELWVAVGDDAGTESLILTSDDDGDTWTARSNPDDKALNGVCWCPSIGLFIACGNPAAGDSYLITSPDGVTWTERSHAKTSALFAVAWSESLGVAVAVGTNDGADAYIISSKNGTTWVERSPTVPKALDLFGVCWCEELALFVAVGDVDTDSYILTSPDGITWTERTSPVAVSLNAVAAAGPTTLVAVGPASGGDATILTSTDGSTWTEQSNPGNHHLYAATGVLQFSSGGAFAGVEEA